MDQALKMGGAGVQFRESADGTAAVDARYEDIWVEPSALFALLKLGEEKRSECLAERASSSSS